MNQNTDGSRPKWVVAFDYDHDVRVWGAVVLDLEGCTSGGDSLEEARANIRDALALHLAGLLSNKQEVPSPLGIERVLANAETDLELRERMRGAILMESDAGELKSRSVRIQITMNEGLLAKVDKLAEHEGMNRSAWLAEAARRQLA